MEPQKGQGEYKFAIGGNYEDYSSGRVLFGAIGASNFPVRLASEILQRGIYYLNDSKKDSFVLYDSFCGAAYTLTVLGFLHSDKIKSIFASDADHKMLEVAEKNLSLLTQAGLNRRAAELKSLQEKYHKKSHKDALESAGKLAKKLTSKDIVNSVFAYDVLSNQKPPVNLKSVDLVIADLPYGKLSKWIGQQHGFNPTQKFLDNIKGFLNPNVLLCISFNKKQEVKHEGFEKIKSFKLGTRKILFLKMLI